MLYMWTKLYINNLFVTLDPFDWIKAYLLTRFNLEIREEQVTSGP